VRPELKKAWVVATSAAISSCRGGIVWLAGSRWS